MAFINENDKEINCKIVFFGPPLCGKSTSLRYIHDKIAQSGKISQLSVSEEDERTLYFDFAPINVGKIKDYDVRMHLYTVPGQKAYEQSRRLISKGVDGLVFMADSSLDVIENNLSSLKELRKIIGDNGLDWSRLPKIFQYNKRDLPSAVPVDELHSMLNTENDPEFETVAIRGEGLLDVLASISERVLLSLKEV